MKFEAGSYLVVIAGEPTPVDGFVYQGVGLSLASDTESLWVLTHLQSGHAICFAVATIGIALEAAAEVAEATDWSFDGVAGWRNRDPDLPKKMQALFERHDGVLQATQDNPRSEAAARAVLVRRGN